MTTNDIVALAKAGFNSQQIAQLARVGVAEQVAQSKIIQEPTPEIIATAPTPQPAAPTPQPAAPAPAPTPQPDKLDEILKAIQAGNIAGTAQPAQESCEDILASIINPKE